MYEYCLPLLAPSGGSRKGLIVAGRRLDGSMAWGEVAPLPGFSRETLEEAKAEVLSVCSGRVDPPGTLASVRCGLEQLARGLRDRRNLQLQRDRIALCALMGAGAATDMARVRACQKAGYSFVKLKVGSQGIDVDIKLVRAVRTMLGSRVSLRVDANRAWKMDEAAAFAAGVRDSSIAYIEEPLADPGGLEELVCRHGVHVALDESLTGREPSWLQKQSFVHTIVLKPTVLGGHSCVLTWARAAESIGMRAVVSAAYESGIGMSGLVEMAACMPRDSGAGLGTYRQLESDVLAPRYDFDGATVTVSSTALAGRQINLRVLERLR